MILPFITAILNRFRGDDTISKAWWFLFMIPMILFVSVDPVVIVVWTMFLAVYAVPPTRGLLDCMMGRPQAGQQEWHWQWMYNATLTIRSFIINKLLIDDGFGMFKGRLFFKKTTFSHIDIWRFLTIFYGFFRGLPCVIPVGLLYGYTDDYRALVGLLLLLQGFPYYVFKKLLMPFPNHGDMPVVYAELTIGYFLGAYLVVL